MDYAFSVCIAESTDYAEDTEGAIHSLYTHPKNRGVYVYTFIRVYTSIGKPVKNESAAPTPLPRNPRNLRFPRFRQQKTQTK